MEEITKLKEENEKLKNISNTKSDLISLSAHQLRTSLSAMKWMLKMFMDGDLGSLSDEQQSFIKKAFSSNDRMIAFVNEMLSITHAEDAELVYEFKPTAIVPLTESALFDFTGESYKKGIQVLFLKPETPVHDVPMDAEKIRIVLQNLIENALKYSNQDDKVFISVKETAIGIEVSVKDTGIGIPEAEQPKIFEKFFRAENAKEKDNMGSGFGLYTSKNIAEHHKGTLTFQSSDAGTTFTLALPLQQ